MMISSWIKQVQCVLNPNYGLNHCEVGWDWQPGALNDYDIWYAVSGTGTMNVSGETYPICKGSCFVLRPGDEPEATQDVHNRLTVIYFHIQFVDQTSGDAVDPQFMPPRFCDIEDTFLIEGLFHRALDVGDRRELLWEDEFDLLMKQVFIYLYRMDAKSQQINDVSAKHAQLIRKVIAYLRSDVSNSLSDAGLAELVGLSIQYLSRVFKQYTGISLKRYRMRMKLERARHLLTESTMNVSQVAQALGYSDLYFFSKQFKKHYGFPPSHFRYKGTSTSIPGST